MTSTAQIFDREDTFVISQSLNEFLHGLRKRPDRPLPPGTLLEFRELLDRVSKNEAYFRLTDKDMALGAYAIGIVLSELDDNEIHPRMGRNRNEIQMVYRKLTDIINDKDD